MSWSPVNEGFREGVESRIAASAVNVRTRVHGHVRHLGVCSSKFWMRGTCGSPLWRSTTFVPALAARSDDKGKERQLLATLNVQRTGGLVARSPLCRRIEYRTCGHGSSE